MKLIFQCILLMVIFRFDRFVIFDINDLEKLLELMIYCSKLNDCNIDELTELLKNKYRNF